MVSGSLSIPGHVKLTGFQCCCRPVIAKLTLAGHGQCERPSPRPLNVIPDRYLFDWYIAYRRLEWATSGDRLKTIDSHATDTGDAVDLCALSQGQIDGTTRYCRQHWYRSKIQYTIRRTWYAVQNSLCNRCRDTEINIFFIIVSRTGFKRWLHVR